MKAIIEHPEVKKCYDELMEIINTPKVIDKSIKDKIWCEVLNQHGCIGKECPCFATFENLSEHDHFPINSEIDFCKYRSRITVEIRINPKQCIYEEYKNKLFLSILHNVRRYKLDNDKKLFLYSLEHSSFDKGVFTAGWAGDYFTIYEDMMKIDNELIDKPVVVENNNIDKKQTKNSLLNKIIEYIFR